MVSKLDGLLWHSCAEYARFDRKMCLGLWWKFFSDNVFLAFFKCSKYSLTLMFGLCFLLVAVMTLEKCAKMCGVVCLDRNHVLRKCENAKFGLYVFPPKCGEKIKIWKTGIVALVFSNIFSFFILVCGFLKNVKKFDFLFVVRISHFFAKKMRKFNISPNKIFMEFFISEMCFRDVVLSFVWFLDE